LAQARAKVVGPGGVPTFRVWEMERKEMESMQLEFVFSVGDQTQGFAHALPGSCIPSPTTENFDLKYECY
jgi:hypothetical protein